MGLRDLIDCCGATREVASPSSRVWKKVINDETNDCARGSKPEVEPKPEPGLPALAPRRGQW